MAVVHCGSQSRPCQVLAQKASLEVLAGSVQRLQVVLDGMHGEHSGFCGDSHRLAYDPVQ